MTVIGTGSFQVSAIAKSWTLPEMYSQYGRGKLFIRGLAAFDHYRPIFPFSAKPTVQRLPTQRAFHSTPIPYSSAQISYRIAASSSGKGRKFDPSKNVYNFNPNTQDSIGLEDSNGDRQSKRKSRPDSGQDAFFVSKVGNYQTMAFGIADGVGGWAFSGVDPADFSHGLCSYMARTALDWSTDTNGKKLKARDLMQIGYQSVIDDPAIPAGGSTACVGIARDDGRLEIANLGDSGFLHLRLSAVHHYSNPQTHAFNTPYQLSIIPPKVLAQSAIFGGTPLQDLPKDASVAEDLTLRHGDVLVLATDGVWDNLNSMDVLGVVSKGMIREGAWGIRQESGGIEVGVELSVLTGPGGVISGNGDGKGEKKTLQGVLASAVAGEAKIASLDSKRDGPFAREVQRYYPEEGYRGGKVDDICVIVVVAVEEGR